MHKDKDGFMIIVGAKDNKGDDYKKEEVKEKVVENKKANWFFHFKILAGTRLHSWFLN